MTHVERTNESKDTSENKSSQNKNNKVNDTEITSD